MGAPPPETVDILRLSTPILLIDLKAIACKFAVSSNLFTINEKESSKNTE